MKKRILILANHFITIYNYRKELIERLVKENYDVYVSCPMEDRIDEIVALGCKYIETSLSRHGINPIAELQLLKNYKKIMKDIKPNIVFTYTIKPNVYGGMVCASLGIPYVPNITGLGTAVENKGMLRFVTVNLYRYALRKAQTVFFQNTANEKFFAEKRIAVGKHKMLPGSGVNLGYHKYKELGNRTKGFEKILFVGRVMKAKGVDEFLEAARKVKVDYPNVEFKIIGFLDGDYKDTLDIAQKQGIIRYMGQISDVRPFYEECDAVVLPSYYEGMANVLLEAAATGRPVIASNIPGCKETFDEGISGIGCEPKNVQSLYNGIIRFLQLPIETRVQMGLAGRRKVEKKFNRDIVINAYMKEIDNDEKNINQSNRKKEKYQNVIV